MGFKEVAALDAEVTVALGKTDKKTGKKGPKQAEGYYLGNRSVKTRKGDSLLHFLQTSEGNLGVWGTTDMNRKLSSVIPGTMIRITSTGTKPTPNGDMYTYKVEVDSENVVEVPDFAVSAAASDESDDESGSDDDASSSDDDTDDDAPATVNLAAEREAQKKKVEELLKRGKTK